MIKTCEYSEQFLYLTDMDREDVEAFIIAVCKTKGVRCDIASELYDVYDRKFERLRFRPLYLQMFVEAWIDNDYAFPQYNSYEQLLEHILEREQDRWIVSVGGDTDVCNAFIRLMVRANISGRISIEKLPDIYKTDWEIIQAYIKNNSFVGKQKREMQDTLINSF